MTKTAMGRYSIGQKAGCSYKRHKFWPVRVNLDITNGRQSLRRHSGTLNDVELAFNEIWPNDPQQVQIEWLELGNTLIEYRDKPGIEPSIYRVAENWIKEIMKKLPNKLGFSHLGLNVKIDHIGGCQFRSFAELTIMTKDPDPDDVIEFCTFRELLAAMNKLFLLRTDEVKKYLVTWAKSETKRFTTPLPDPHDNKEESSIIWIESIWQKYPYERPHIKVMAEEETEAYKNYKPESGFESDPDK